MKASIDRERITPAQARMYLEENGPNRPLVDKRVVAIAGAIRRGEWVENGETIKFNGDGTLVDGQHRLAAIAASGKAVPVWVVRGISTAAQETVDIGSARTVGNMLAIRGVPYANHQSSAARIIWLYRTTGVLDATASNIAPTPQQLLQIVDETPGLLDWVKWGQHGYDADRSLRLGPGYRAGLGFLLAEHSTEEDAKAFFDELRSPKRESDPTALMRTHLLRNSPTMKLKERARSALLIKTWNAWIQGEHPKRLTWRSGGASAEEFPVIYSPNDDPSFADD